jgi:ATP-binding cassette subfamily B protein
MEHGRIVEQGQHDELLAREGVYARMWSLQWQQGELEHAQRKVSAQAVGLDALVAGVIDALHEEIAARGVNLYTVIAEPGLRVSGDASVLQQVVADLCRAQMSAAMRSERIELRVFREGNHASLTVMGQRPDPADLSQQQVRRLENALTETGGSLAVRYIDKHVAYVATMPLRPVLDETAAPEASHDDALKGVTVMVLDDQEEARDALEGLLESVGAHVVLCASGDDALARLRALPSAQWPDVLLCDIVLGGEQDGYEVLRLVREEEASRGVSLGERMPAIALTGHTQAEARSRAQAAGFQAHLTKPVPAPKLIAAIDAVTARTI